VNFLSFIATQCWPEVTKISAGRPEDTAHICEEG